MRPTAKHADADFIRDTNPEALQVFYGIQRRRTGEQKLADAFDLSDGLFEIAKEGVRMRYPEAPEREVFLRAVGGSFASSFHGIARATQDIDVVVELPEVVAKALYLALSPDFYADDEAMLDAIRVGLSFNLIHLESGHKFDLFVAGRHPLGEEQLMHRRFATMAILGGAPLEIPLVSAEDIILVKLLWYRARGEVSERQWNDLVNLAEVQKTRADYAYLAAQAARVGVTDLLTRLWGD